MPAEATTAPDQPASGMPSERQIWYVAKLLEMRASEIASLDATTQQEIARVYDDLVGPINTHGALQTRRANEFKHREVAAGRFIEFIHVNGGPLDPRRQPDFPGQIVTSSMYFDQDQQCHMTRVVKVNPGDDPAVDEASRHLEAAKYEARRRFRQIIDRGAPGAR